jgi:hypothetical protein
MTNKELPMKYPEVQFRALRILVLEMGKIRVGSRRGRSFFIKSAG